MTTYDWYKSRGICPRCGSENAFKGHVYCLNCLDKGSLATMKYRDNMTPEKKAKEVEKNKIYCKTRYQKAKEQGLCVRCCKNTPRPGTVTCQKCFNKIRVNQKVYQQEKRDRLKGLDSKTN